MNFAESRYVFPRYSRWNWENFHNNSATDPYSLYSLPILYKVSRTVYAALKLPLDNYKNESPDCTKVLE